MTKILPNKMKEWLEQHRQGFFWGGLVVLFLVWLWLRFYRLSTSYLFFSDAGRDIWAVYKIAVDHQLTLLGPGTSYIPINLSPLYFYLLAVFFILTNHSYFYAHVALAVYTWFFIFATAFCVRNHRQLQLSFLLTIALFCFSPLIIDQSRGVWNPSFVWPPLVMAIYCLLLANISHKQTWLLRLAGLLTALSITFNLSVLPVLFGLSVMIVISGGKKVWQYWLGCFTAVIIFHLPLLLFELKYHFQMTNRLFSTLAAQGLSNDMAQSLSLRIVSLLKLSVGNIYLAVWSLVVVIAITIGAYLRCHRQIVDQLWFKVLLGLIVTAIMTLIPPVKIEIHYVLGIASLFMVLITLLPHRINYLVSIMILLFYLATMLTRNYFVLARRTVAEFDQCMALVCESVGPQPTYHALKSKYIPWGSDDSYRYGLTKAGCRVKQIATEPNQAQQMIVFTEGTEFVYGQDKFYETELFGEATVAATGSCRDDWGWIVLEKQDASASSEGLLSADGGEE